MKKRGMRSGKKGQIMGMPFSLIFALIIVVVALVVGIWAIRTFLHRAEQANIYDFTSKFQSEISSIWSGPEEAQVTKTLAFSSRFTHICIIDPGRSCSVPPSDHDYPKLQDFCTDYKDYETGAGENFFLVPLGKAEAYDSSTGWSIKCARTKDCLIIQGGNPLCLEVVRGKVTFKLIKESGKPYVTISKA